MKLKIITKNKKYHYLAKDKYKNDNHKLDKKEDKPEKGSEWL